MEITRWKQIRTRGNSFYVLAAYSDNNPIVGFITYDSTEEPGKEYRVTTRLFSTGRYRGRDGLGILGTTSDEGTARAILIDYLKQIR